MADQGGFYTIRPYHKSDMLLCGYNGNACITTSDYIDSYSSSNSGMWMIYADSMGYIFQYNGQSGFTMQVYNSLTSLGAAVKAAGDTGTASSRWTLEAVTSASNGIQFYNTSGSMITSTPSRYVAVGETKTMSNITLKAQVYYNGTLASVRVYNNAIRYSSDSTGVAAVVNTSGNVTGVAEGTAVITAAVSSQNLARTYNLNVISMQNGTYYVQNRTTEKYVQIDDGATNTAGAVLEQWEFDGGNDQKWIITSLNNGYYKIASKQTGYAISVPAGSETTENVSLVQQVYTGATRQQWKITKTSNGSYKIKARSSESYTAKDLVMDIGTSIDYSSSGISVSQMNYVDNYSYRDEWIIYSCSVSVVNLDLVYDNGYNNRYTNASERIQNELSILQKKYLEEFGIYIRCFEPQIFASYADSNCSSYSTTCSHSGETQCVNSVLNTDGTVNLSSLHHKNIYNIMCRIPLPDLSETVRMAYIGHNNCVQVSDKHMNNAYNGLTYISFGLITVMNFSTEVSETRTMIHEFGHLYSAPDHYGGSQLTTAQIIDKTGDNRFSMDCIYGENRNTEDVLENFTICEGCKARIIQNKDRFNHN